MQPIRTSERSRAKLKPRFHRLRQARRKGQAAFDAALDTMQCDLQDIVASHRAAAHGGYMAQTKHGPVHVKT